MVGGGLYASAWLGIQPWVGSVAEVSWFTRGVGFEDGSGSANPTPGACVELPTWQLHPYPCGGDMGSGYPYPANRWHGTCADRRQLLLPPPPPSPAFRGVGRSVTWLTPKSPQREGGCRIKRRHGHHIPPFGPLSTTKGACLVLHGSP